MKISRLIILAFCLFTVSPLCHAVSVTLGSRTVSVVAGTGEGKLMVTWSMSGAGGINLYHVSASGSEANIGGAFWSKTSGSGTEEVTVDGGGWVLIYVTDGVATHEQNWIEAPSCPFAPYRYTVNNSAGAAAKVVRVVAIPAGGGAPSVVYGPVSVAAHATTVISGSVKNCGSFQLDQQTVNSEGAPQWEAYQGGLGQGQGDAPGQLPDPTPPPTVPTSTSVGAIPTPPDTTPVDPPQTTNGGKVEERNSKGQLDITKHIATVIGLGVQTNTNIQKQAEYQSERLASIDENIKIMKRNDEERRNSESAVAANMRTNTEIDTHAKSQKQQGEALIESLQMSDTGTAPSSGPSAQTSIFTITIANYVFDLDPASSSLVSAGAAWVKTLIMWVVLILYVFWAVNFLEHKIEVMAVVPQARGNPVFAGTGAQLTAFSCAVAITAAIFVAIPAIWAIATIPVLPSGGSMTTSVSGAGSFLSSASSSVINGALYLVWFFVPVSYLVSVGIHVLVFRKAALVVFVGVLVFIKNFTL